MDLNQMTDGEVVWACELLEWGPEPCVVVCPVERHLSVAVRRDSGEVVSVDGSSCWPTQAEALAACMVRTREGIERGKKIAAKYYRAADRIAASAQQHPPTGDEEDDEPTHDMGDPVGRDPEAVFPAAADLPTVDADATAPVRA